MSCCLKCENRRMATTPSSVLITSKQTLVHRSPTLPLSRSAADIRRLPMVSLLSSRFSVEAFAHVCAFGCEYLLAWESHEYGNCVFRFCGRFGRSSGRFKWHPACQTIPAEVHVCWAGSGSHGAAGVGDHARDGQQAQHEEREGEMFQNGEVEFHARAANCRLQESGVPAMILAWPALAFV